MAVSPVATMLDAWLDQNEAETAAQSEIGVSPVPTQDEWQWVSVVRQEPRGKGRLGFKPRNPPPLLDYVGPIGERRYAIFVKCWSDESFLYHSPPESGKGGRYNIPAEGHVARSNISRFPGLTFCYCRGARRKWLKWESVR